MKRRLLMLSAAALLAGCATGPSVSDLGARIPPIPQQMGRIWFYRSGTPFGAAVQPAILVNGSKVGDAVPGGAFWRDAMPGNYEVSTSTEVENKLTFTLAAGEVRFVETHIVPGILVGRIVPRLVQPEQGREDIASKSLTSPL